jgi:hypothetical protein
MPSRWRVCPRRNGGFVLQRCLVTAGIHLDRHPSWLIEITRCYRASQPPRITVSTAFWLTIEQPTRVVADLRPYKESQAKMETDTLRALILLAQILPVCLVQDMSSSPPLCFPLRPTRVSCCMYLSILDQALPVLPSSIQT